MNRPDGALTARVADELETREWAAARVRSDLRRPRALMDLAGGLADTCKQQHGGSARLTAKPTFVIASCGGSVLVRICSLLKKQRQEQIVGVCSADNREVVVV